LAEAAYDVTKLPARWKLVATIQPGDFGFVAISDNITAISFGGTEVRGEWLKDFDGIALPNRFGRGLMHQGFQDQYVELRTSLLAALKLAASLHPSSLMWITGHSLGAALATLFACDTTMVGGFQRLTYTWAGPRVGWHDFAQWFEECWGPLYRIVNEWDVVPHAPPLVNCYERSN